MSKKIRLAGIAYESLVNGPGMRRVYFSQGCRHNCEGCFNPDTHDFNGGEELDMDELIEDALDNPLLKGITFSGGDPLERAEEFAYMAKAFKKAGLNIWCYTGYTFEDVLEKMKKDNNIKDLIENKKMTIKNSNYREIEAENGLGENIVYKLNENNKIVISFSVRLTTILNDGKYDISGSIFSNILIEVLNDSKYIKDINEAIGNYFTEEKDIYTKDINELKIDVSQEFDFIKITVTV